MVVVVVVAIAAVVVVVVAVAVIAIITAEIRVIEIIFRSICNSSSITISRSGGGGGSSAHNIARTKINIQTDSLPSTNALNFVSRFHSQTKNLQMFGYSFPLPPVFCC